LAKAFQNDSRRGKKASPAKGDSGHALPEAKRSNDESHWKRKTLPERGVRRRRRTRWKCV